jgi:hypothetical protein
MLPIAVDMTAKRVCGIYNFCNPGVISHNEILDMYRKVCMFHVYVCVFIVRVNTVFTVHSSRFQV